MPVCLLVPPYPAPPATFCQVVPSPPPSVGLVWVPSEDSSISLGSDTQLYNPSIPINMEWPSGFCDGQQKLLLVANIMVDTKTPELPELILVGKDKDHHVLHLLVDLEKEYISRYTSIVDCPDDPGVPGGPWTT